MTTATYDNSCFTRVVICSVVIAFTAGCTSMRTVSGDDAAGPSDKVWVGEKVKITRNDLSSVKFRVTEISDDGISGDGIFVAYTDIQQLQVRHKNNDDDGHTNKAGAIIGGVLVAVVALPLWLAAGALQNAAN